MQEPRLLVTGQSGRMGQSVLLAAAEAGVAVVATHDVGAVSYTHLTLATKRIV